MAKAKLLAFLLCDNATRDRDGKVTLQGIFDQITRPRSPREVKVFFVYYRVLAEEPCSVSLRVLDPAGQEVPKGSRRDSLPNPGPMHTVWSLSSGSFERPGNYLLELRQEDNDSEPHKLAEMSLVVRESEG